MVGTERSSGLQFAGCFAAQATNLMSIFNHNVFENIRTRAIVLHGGRLLLIPPGSDASEAAWGLPGGGLRPHESLAECLRREVLEETGIHVRIGRVVFLREWVIPKYAQSTGPDPDARGYGYGLEVFHYASPEEPLPEPRPERAGAPAARWIPLADVASLALWPKEVKVLCQRLLDGRAPEGTISVLGRPEGPLARPEYDPFD
jgi:8-oxo-dGTP diphosphatase